MKLQKKLEDIGLTVFLNYVWEKDGKIMVRQSDTSNIIQLQSMTQLMSIVTNAPSQGQLEAEESDDGVDETIESMQQ